MKHSYFMFYEFDCLYFSNISVYQAKCIYTPLFVRISSSFCGRCPVLYNFRYLRSNGNIRGKKV